MKYRVSKAHRSDILRPLTASTGKTLAFERRESECPGWIWCRTGSGMEGWVPENWVIIEGQTCKLRRDYNARELSVSEGEVLTASLFESGWVWVTGQSGETGWVPLACLEEL